MIFANPSLDIGDCLALIVRDFPAILSIMYIPKDLKTREEALKYVASPGATGNTQRHKPPTSNPAAVEPVVGLQQAAGAIPLVASNGVKTTHKNTGTVTASKFGTRKDIFRYIECDNPQLREIICLSRASSTWDSYLTAWRCFEQFCLKREISYSLPCDIDMICDFLAFMCYEKNLESTTALSYLSALRLLHVLNKYEDSQFDDGLVDIFKEGVTNNSLIHDSTTVSRHVITWEVLQILGFQLHNMGKLNPIDVQVVWLACLLAYHGSMRMGELVSYYVYRFDTVRGITWNKLKFVQGTLVIHARLPKCSEDKSGKFVNFFQYETNKSLCPIFNAFKLIKMKGNVKNSDPVFRLSSGKLLTMAKTNAILKAHLSPILPGGKYTCHSFRLEF